MNPFQRAREEAAVARAKLLGKRAGEAVHVKDFLTSLPVETAFSLAVYPAQKGSSELPSGDANLRREDNAIYVCNKKDDEEKAYLVAHELGHFHLDEEKAANTLADLAKSLAPEGTKASASVEAYGARERNELRANVFARELLLPRDVARKLFASGMGPREVAKKYGLHLEVVRQQMLDAVLLPQVAHSVGPKPVHPPSPDQVAAAQAAEIYANVVAGPGSGKTKTLVDRVRYLIEVKKVEPRHILVLTFTNKAALELVDRLRDAGISRASDIWAGTFHAFGLEFIRKYHQYFKVENDVAVADKLSSIVMLNRGLGKVSLQYYKRLQDPYEWLPKVVDAIKRLKEEMVTPATYRERIALLGSDDAPANLRREDVATLYELHEQLLAQRKMVDFVDLVARPAAELQKDRAKYSELADRFKHVLVDEYQDVTHAMVQLITQLANKKQAIWVVGDVRQAIHHWRGASVQSLRRFGTSFEKQASASKLKTYSLEFNRRSSPQIAKLIDQVGTRHVLHADPHLRLTASKTTGKSGPQPRLFTCNPGSSIPDAIAREIAASSSSYSQQAVLSRANHEVERLAQDLTQRGIPTLYIGDLSRRREVKILLCLMHLLVERTPRALVGLMAIPELAISGADLPLLMQASEKDPKMQIGGLIRSPPAGLSKQSTNAIAKIRKLIGDHTLSSSPWSFTCDILLERRFGFPALADVSIDAHSMRIALWQFAYSTRIGDGESKVIRLVRFLQRQQLRRRINETYAERELPAEAASLDAVRMMTVHASKGLEFEVVHLANVEDDDYGEFGSAWKGLPDILELVPPPVLNSSLKEWKNEAATERNNLLYVAVSRAMRDLVMYQSGDAPDKFVSQLNRLPSACVIKSFSGPTPAPLKTVSRVASLAKAVPITLAELETYAKCPLQHWYRYRLELPPESFLDVSIRAQRAVMVALESFAKAGKAGANCFKSEWEKRRLPSAADDPQLHAQALDIFNEGVELIETSVGTYSEQVAMVNGLPVKLPWTLTTPGYAPKLEAIEFFFTKPKSRDATWRPLLHGLQPAKAQGAKVHSLLTGDLHSTTPSGDVSMTGMFKAVDRFREGVQTAKPGTQCRYCPYATVCPSRPPL